MLPSLGSIRSAFVAALLVCGGFVSFTVASATVHVRPAHAACEAVR